MKLMITELSRWKHRVFNNFSTNMFFF